jgi:hypothetical protein
MLGLLNTYLVSKRFEIRRLREQLISTTLQNQVIEQQSFIDPLTEIYNRHSLDQIASRFISQAMRRPLDLLHPRTCSIKNGETGSLGKPLEHNALRVLRGVHDSSCGSDFAACLRYALVRKL